MSSINLGLFETLGMDLELLVDHPSCRRSDEAKVDVGVGRMWPPCPGCQASQHHQDDMNHI